MAVLLTAPATTGTSGYTLLIADDAEQVAAAQRLRHEVFAGELGATLPGGVAGPGRRRVRRVLRPPDRARRRHRRGGRHLPDAAAHRAARAGRRYADGEFDLAALRPLRDQLVETGRSCVHPDHRTGAVINLMWAGIARYLHLNGCRWLGGCASVPLDDGGATAAGGLGPGPRQAPVAARAAGPPAPPVAGRAGHRAAGRRAGRGRRRGTGRRAAAAARLPAAGRWVCGEPAYDPDFGFADFYVLLSMDRIDPRYRRHFLGGDADDRAARWAAGPRCCGRQLPGARRLRVRARAVRPLPGVVDRWPASLLVAVLAALPVLPLLAGPARGGRRRWARRRAARRSGVRLVARGPAAAAPARCWSPTTSPGWTSSRCSPSRRRGCWPSARCAPGR